MFAVTPDAIDADAVRRAVEGGENGAVVVFHGTVRDRTGARRVTHLEYEAYAPMAIRQMEHIGKEVVRRQGLSALACMHRLGRLQIGETAVVVAASAPHRRAALEAVEEFIARLKQDVPIWKKEHFEGGAVWVGTPDDPQGARAQAPEGAR
ncbi:MAG: molybdenum cofactor biosynthesis protein MoaE [Planctomycetota bacterium]|jgi:molybdopterin synthase catalytic subunit